MARWDMMCWFLLSVKSCFAFRSWSVFPSQRQRRRLVIYEPPIDPINNQREIEIIPYSDMLLFAAGNEDIQVETPQYSDEEMKEIMDLGTIRPHQKANKLLYSLHRLSLLAFVSRVDFLYCMSLLIDCIK